MQSTEFEKDDSYKNPPRQEYPDWLKKYIDEATGSVDYDGLINDGRYIDYQRWLQNRVTPVPPKSGQSSVKDTRQEVRTNIWNSVIESDYLN
jgi:hypothetical protein